MSIPTMTLGQGFRPFLLNHLKDIVTEGNLPQTKIEHVGFLNLLQSQNKPNILRLNTNGGHRESVQIKYLQRLTEEFTGTSESAVCNNTLFESYKEASATLTSFRFIPLYLGDEILAQYEDDATAYANLGKPATTIMNEMVERIMTAANAIMGGVRTDLLTQLVANIGFNRATGSAASKTINIPLDTNVNPLNEGPNEILTDFDINLSAGDPMILADPSGLFSKWMMQQYAKGLAQNGLNTPLEAGRFQLYKDAKIASLLATNDILAIQRNAVQIVEYMQFVGFKAGPKPGASVFGTLKLPMQVSDRVIPVEFDFQLRYNDCVTTLTDQYYGTPVTLQKGWTIIMSKKCGLFQIPADAYRGTDPMKQVNGVFRYSVTNL